MSVAKKKTPTPEQRRAADPERSVWVAASAGSGKTQVLVDRVIRLLLEGAAPDAILCLTFTKAAAAEMSNRLFTRLGEWTGLGDDALTEILKGQGVAHVNDATRATARRLFARALETPGGLKIQTIHAFCERLLQLFPVESGMAPGFRIMDQQETDALFRTALLSALGDPDDDSKQAWDFLLDGSILTLDALEGLAKKFLSASNGMRQRLSDYDSLVLLEQNLKALLGVAPDTSADDVMNELNAIDERSYQGAIAALMPLERDAEHSAPFFLGEALRADTDAARLDALKRMVLTGTGTIRKSIIRKPATKREPQWAQWLEDERQRILALLEELGKQQTLGANLSIYRAMARVLARINTTKRAQGLYDFDDLIARTARLLEGYEAAQWVLYKLDKGLTHILVDEAQDTSPAQWTIIKALAGEFFTGEQPMGIKRTIFAVGDLKQSIYSFQGADIEAFEAARAHFKTLLAAQQQKLDEVPLALSYRSNHHVLDAVDQVFAPDSRARRGFGPRAQDERPHTPFAKERQGLVEFWQLETQDDDDEGDSWAAPVDKPARNHPRLKLAERMARTIKSWIGTRQLTGQDRAVQAGDILILLQSRSSLFNALLGALRRHHVPVAGADRLKLQHSIIVQDMLMLGQFLRLPQDDHALACILKSPLMPRPVDEKELLALAHGRSSSLWARLPEDDANRQLLAHLMVTTDTPFMLFQGLLQIHRKAILERLGNEAEDAAQEFLNLALDYEQQQGTSLQGFLDWFRARETDIKREMAQGSGDVRLMTVHGAKGLEAPIVFLADAGDPPSSKTDRLVTVLEEGPNRNLLLFNPETVFEPRVMTRLKDAEKQAALAERLRLLYVGMTRAADELYICGVEGSRKLSEDSWYAHVQAAFPHLPDVRFETTADGFTLHRFGAQPESAGAERPATPAMVEVPAWAEAPVAAASVVAPVLTASRNSDAFDKVAVAEGIATHRLVDIMAKAKPDERLIIGQRWAKRLKLDEGLVPRLATALALPELAPLFGDDGQAEVAIEGTVPGLGRVTGRMDRMAMVDDTIWLVDFKTNRFPPRMIGSNHPYAVQMARYQALLQQAYPGHAVKAALFWTQSGSVMWLPTGLLSQALEQMRQETA